MTSVLIIDDNILIRRMLRRHLEREGYEVLEAEDGEKALVKWSAFPTDIVITDIFMPKKNGLSVIKELTQMKEVPKIVALSGSDYTEELGNYLTLAIEFGADKAFRKPINLAVLSDAIRELVREPVGIF